MLPMPIATISSIELVELINSLRPEGKAELRHDNFMVKIENHPGIASPKFLGHVEVSVGNKALQQLGYLEQRTRPSSCGTEERKFWAVSKAGLKFGKNVTSPANPKEVQPHWYERTGAELVRLLESI